MILEEQDTKDGILAIDDLEKLLSKVTHVTQLKMPHLQIYAVEDAVSEAITDHIEKVRAGTYKPLSNLFPFRS